MKNYQLKTFWPWAVLIVITTIVAITLYSLVSKFEGTRLSGHMRAEKRSRAFWRLQNSQTASKPEAVEGWMTFRYLNTVFKLPTNYFKDALKISDKNYPNLTINSLAKAQKIDAKNLLVRVVILIQNYSTLNK